MDITFIKTCKNPYYNKMPIDEFRNVAIATFPDIATKIATTPSRQLIAKHCRAKLNQIGIDYSHSFKKGKIYTESGKNTLKNNIISDEIKGIDLITWINLKKNGKYNRNCYRTDVMKSIIVNDDDDIKLLSDDDIKTFYQVGNIYFIDYEDKE